MAQVRQRVVFGILVLAAVVVLVIALDRMSRKGIENDVSKLPNPTPEQVADSISKLIAEFKKPVQDFAGSADLFLLGALADNYQSFLRLAESVEENDRSIGYSFGKRNPREGEGYLLVVVDKKSGKIFLSMFTVAVN